MHCFSGDRTVAGPSLTLGFSISFAGPLTYKNTDPLRAIAAWAPADRLLIETDAPYLPPAPHRGKRNEPAYVPLIAAALAQDRNLPPEAAAHLTTTNARRNFRLASAA